jgi:hypothetical protein
MDEKRRVEKYFSFFFAGVFVHFLGGGVIARGRAAEFGGND